MTQKHQKELKDREAKLASEPPCPTPSAAVQVDKGKSRFRADSDEFDEAHQMELRRLQMTPSDAATPHPTTSSPDEPDAAVPSPKPRKGRGRTLRPF